MSRAPVAILLLLIAAPQAVRGQSRGALSVSLSAGVDGNPGRALGDTDADALVALAASARGATAVGKDHQLAGRLDLGLRKFAQSATEDVSVQQAEGSWSRRLGFAVVGAELAGKLRWSRSGSRDYADGSAGGFLDLPLRGELALRLGLGGRYFHYWPDTGYSSAGPQADLALRWKPWRRILLSVGATGAFPGYRGVARVHPGAPEEGADRTDRQVSGWVSASYRGPLALQAGYLWGRVSSNSFGENLERHRLSGAVSARLGPKLFLTAQAAWQLLRYPDGLYLASDLLLEDDEAQSSASGKLAWALGERVEVEARYGLYWIVLPAGAGSIGATSGEYLRQVATAGLLLRW